MRLLILGGTRFLGRAVARLARDAGHEVSCAARGTSGRPVDGVRFVAVDRDQPTGLSALDGEVFDAVVDVTSRPSHLRHAIRALDGRVGHWSYVSTISVYADDTSPGQRVAGSPLLEPAPPEVDDPTGADRRWYPGCKVACERLVREAVPADQLFVCRAGVIVGPEDPSDRFPYWVRRLAVGGEVLAPGGPDEPVQVIDVEDLAGWLLHAAATGLAGTYDGIAAPVPRRRFLTDVAAGVGLPEPSLTWVDQEFLAEHDVRPWTGERALPFWVPLPEYAGLLSRDVTDSLAAGLVTRSVVESARATYRWMTIHPDAVRSGGLMAEAETNVLREWHARLG